MVVSIASSSGDEKAEEFKLDSVLHIGTELIELSGAVRDNRNGFDHYIWMIGDGNGGGDDTELSRYNVNTKKLLTLKVDKAKNQDWEALVQLDDGDLLILDVGDNQLNRKSITMYLIDPATFGGQVKVDYDEKIIAEYEKYSYEEKTPNYEVARNVEAAFVVGNMIYLIEKNLGLKKPRLATIDLLEDRKNIKVKEAGFLDSKYLMGSITDAAILGSELFMLTYNGVYSCPLGEVIGGNMSYKDAKCKRGTDRKVRIKGLTAMGQTESLIVLSDTNFLIGGENGKFYQWKDDEFLKDLDLLSFLVDAFALN